MKVRIIPLLLCFSLLACCDSRPPAQKPIPYLKVEGDDVLIPSFEVVLDVDQKAIEKLKSEKEGILILSYFTGSPTKEAEKKYPEFEIQGEITLAKTSVEMTDGHSAKIENVRFPKARYLDLADKDINVLVNVVSARKSSSENLLDCGIVQGKMSAIMGKSFTIKCRLINGN